MNTNNHLFVTITGHEFIINNKNKNNRSWFNIWDNGKTKGNLKFACLHAYVNCMVLLKHINVRNEICKNNTEID